MERRERSLDWHPSSGNGCQLLRFLISAVLWSSSTSSIALVALVLIGLSSSVVVVSFHIVPISPRFRRRHWPTFVTDKHNHSGGATILPSLQSSRIWSTKGSSLAATTTTDCTVVSTTTTLTKNSASVEIVPPDGSFRNTLASNEVSVVSFNALAPSYHVLGLSKNQSNSSSNSSSSNSRLLEEEEEAQRNAIAQQDRKSRVPFSIASAKQKNADILCLQEVEGGPAHEPILAKLLAADEVVCNAHDNQGKSLNDDDDPTATTTTTTTTSTTIEGYDSYVWSPLHPKRQHIDVVGLCVAWRSTRYQLVSACESFQRGMVVQLANVKTGAIIIVGNVHLPAKPSAIEGRLRSISKTIRAIQELSTSTSASPTFHSSTRSSDQDIPLDGMVIIAGDMNCEHNAPSSNLMMKGYTLYGTLHDRNYKVKITKNVASQMKHSYRFRNVYRDNNEKDNNDDCRRRRAAAALVTVSLAGRGPGCMDMMYFAPSCRKTTRRAHQQLQSQHPLYRAEAKGRRSRRREKKKETSSSLSSFQGIRVQSVLATMDQNELTGATATTRKNQIILSGLPNESEGFYSDHLPIGALFASLNNDHPDAHDGSSFSTCSRVALPGEQSKKSAIMKKIQEPMPKERYGISSSSRDNESHHGRDTAHQAASPARRRRREVYEQSVRVRQRHNAVLRTLAEWLIDRGATDVLRDQPLYKWKWVIDGHDGSIQSDDSKSQGRLSKKMRAPDLCCVLPKTQTLVIVEVTIVGSEKLNEARREKLSKYRDVVQFLGNRSNSAGISVGEENDAQKQQTACPWARVENIVIVLDVFGKIPQPSWKDLERLAFLSSATDGQVDRNDNDDIVAESRLLGNALSCIVQDENETWNSTMEMRNVV